VSDQHDRILILDFGSQVTQLIARRVREAHVYCEIHPNDVSDQFIRDFKPRGIILSGSHASTYEDRDLRAPQAVWEAGVPVLGICYGMFTMAVQLGGEVEPSTHREFGYAEVRAHGHSRLLNGIEDFSTTEGHGMLKVWMSHGDKVTRLPAGVRPHGLHAKLPDRRHGRRGTRLLRGAVPSRGDPHGAGGRRCSTGSCSISPGRAPTG
jgi:GMP synthase (glutamine-hydrolysing)